MFEKKLFCLLLILILNACSGQERNKSTLSVEKKVSNLISNKQYTEALELTNKANPAKTRNIDSLKFEIYFSYSQYLLNEADTSLATEQLLNALKLKNKVIKARSTLLKIACDQDLRMEVISNENQKILEDILTECTYIDITNKVNQFIATDSYDEALNLLSQADPAKTEADLQTLKEKTHLNYGIYLEYRGPEGSSMRDRMTSALEQYIAVLKINPNNQKAVSEIEQIMSIYSTVPDRSPGEEIVQELNELGFDY